MLFKTEGIVLHSVRYGDTSVIVRIFTELFGIQSYLVNGVRSARAKSGKANVLQPAHILDMVVYHREHKNLQRISDFRPAYLYKNLYSNVIKNAIALYISELLYNCLSEPESHPELFYFAKQSLQWMDVQPASTMTNFPHYFTLHTAALLGFKIYGRYSAHTPFLDLKEGQFVSARPSHDSPENEEARYTDELLQTARPEDMRQLQIPEQIRNNLLTYYLHFLQLHLPGFRPLRSPGILRDVLH